MVHRRTIGRILLETIGEILIIGAVFLFDKSYIFLPLRLELIGILVLFGVLLRIYGDEISLAIYEGHVKDKLFTLYT